MKILITGGAGFIGKYLLEEIDLARHEVVVLDNFSPQVHSGRNAAEGISDAIRIEEGDVRDSTLVKRLVAESDSVIHLAAETGTGQSMYEIGRYQQVNIGGLANILEAVAKQEPRRTKKVILASSRAVYGEGAYSCHVHGRIEKPERSVDDMLAGRFGVRCPVCGVDAELEPTVESHGLGAASVYGITKKSAEELLLVVAKNLGISAYALRYQNVYGPGQALSNPYVGIIGIFAQLASQGRELRVFEDGQMVRDFVHVRDTAKATAALIADQYQGIETLNVGSGEGTKLIDVAESIVENLFSNSEIAITGQFRLGDIRGCISSNARVESVIGFNPSVSFQTGLAEYLRWFEANYHGGGGSYDKSLEEMKALGLLKEPES